MNLNNLVNRKFTIPSAIVLFLVFVIAKLPAHQLIPRLTLPEQIKVSGLSGTIWSGQAEFVQYSGIQINNVNWQLDWLPLLWGAASFELQSGNRRDAEQIAIRGSFSLTMSTVQAEDTTIYAPTPLILAQVSLPLPVRAGGRVKADINKLEYNLRDGCQTLSGTGNWLNASVAGAKADIDLGNFSAKMQCDQGPVTITTEPENTLNITAIATLPHRGDIRVSGKFKVSDELPREVHSAAQYIGNIDPDGFHIIDL